MRSWNRLITLLYCEVEINCIDMYIRWITSISLSIKNFAIMWITVIFGKPQVKQGWFVFFLYFILSLKVASIAVKIYNPSELIIFFFCNNRYVHMFGTQWKHFIVWLNCCDLFNSYTGVRTGLGFTRCVISPPKVLFVWRNN